MAHKRIGVYRVITEEKQDEIIRLSAAGESVLKIRDKVNLTYVQVYNFLKYNQLQITLENPDKGFNHKRMRKAKAEIETNGFFDEMKFENWLI